MVRAHAVLLLPPPPHENQRGQRLFNDPQNLQAT